MPRNIRRFPRKASMELIPMPPMSFLFSFHVSMQSLDSQVAGFLFPDSSSSPAQDAGGRFPSCIYHFDMYGRGGIPKPEVRLLQYSILLQEQLLLPHQKRCGCCLLPPEKHGYGFLHHEVADPLPPEQVLSGNFRTLSRILVGAAPVPPRKPSIAMISAPLRAIPLAMAAIL